MISWEKCLFACLCMEKIVRTNLIFVPAVLCTVGLVALCFSGCKKSEKETALPSNSPAVYMKDPAFRAALDEKAKELRRIVKEREPLAKRMEELACANNKDLAALQKNAEWTNLYARVVALNEEYQAVRQRQLKVVKDRLGPVGPRPQGGKREATGRAMPAKADKWKNIEKNQK